MLIVFVGSAIVLFALRSNDATAGLCTVALALSGVASSGPLYGLEQDLPLGRLLTVFAWIAGPSAFPVIALAILYFPSPSPRLTRFPLLHAVPFIAAAPMILGGLVTSLYLAGVDSVRPAALWDASHPSAFHGSFAAALGINLLAVIEGILRYRFNHNARERRIRLALYTAVTGVLAYAVKDGVPIITRFAGAPLAPWPWVVDVFLHLLMLTAAFGLLYSVGVAQILGPRVGLEFDLGRMRRRLERQPGAGELRASTMHVVRMTECPRCGRCEDSDVGTCPADGAAMKPVSGVPSVLDGKYRLEQLLGGGGMGAVYRALDMRLERQVAVKLVRAELIGDPEAHRRFRREAQIVGRLQHPGIVAVFDSGTLPDGGAYLVMELIPGEDLRRVLNRDGRLEPARAWRILSSVCAAIEAAHRQGILHRDLKPENILLPGDDADAKVLDFGVATVVSANSGNETVAAAHQGGLPTVEAAIVGTPAYMAPEQLRGRRPDARTDVFSLGVIAYEMLTGELPFGRGSLEEVILAQGRGLPPAAMAAMSAPVARAVRSALDYDPDRRPPSPQAFAHLMGAAAAST